MAIWVDELTEYFKAKITQALGVECKFYHPDGNESELTLPIVTFFDYDLLPDRQRDQSKLKVIRRVDNETVAISDFPVPYKLFFQFTVSSLKKSEDSWLNLALLKLFPERGSIFVFDPVLQEDVEIFMEMTSFKNADSMLETERIFKKRYHYALHVEIKDEEVQVPTVKEVNMNIKLNLG